MRCQGRPEDGRCPDNKNDNTVHNTIRDLFLCNACEEYRWPTVGATTKLPISGAFASRKPTTRQNMKSTTEKPSTKKASSKGRAHSISISNNSGNDGHDDETTEKSQSPSLPDHDHDTEQNATFMNDDTDLTTSIAFITYVRPLLEYATTVWSPYTLTDISKIESVQRSFTKRLPGLSNLPYTKRLEVLGIDSLEIRRLRYDLVFVYKMLFGLADLNFSDYFALRTGPVA